MKTCSAILLYLITVSTAAGQFSLLKDACPGSSGNNGSFIQKLKPGSWVANWYGGNSLGKELWITDGTPAGTTLIKDLNPGPDWGVGYSSDRLGAVMKNEFYFAGSENSNNLGLYKTDGTAAGTSKVGPPLIPYSITNIDNTLFFGGGTTQYGTELYKSDGTTGGTVLVKDIWPGTAGGLGVNGTGRCFVKANGYIFFRGNDGVHGYELWQTDGTTAGTQIVKDILSGIGSGMPGFYEYGTEPSFMVEMNGNLYFIAQRILGHEELWRTDGTASGTYEVAPLDTLNFHPFHSQLMQMNGHLYFFRKVNNSVTKLFTSDGTMAGTKEVTTQGFDLGSGYAGYIAKGYSLFYFSASTPATGVELWRSDGTAAGTFMIKDLNPGPANVQYEQINYGNCLVNWNDIYFSSNNGQTGIEMYSSDGSPGNINLLFDAVPGITGSYPYLYSNVANRLTAKLFTVAYGEENWISDKPILFLDLLSFTGVADGLSARLQWKTRNEENTSHFEIERSIDSNSFNRIATVQVSGGNVMETAYSYTDPALSSGTYYYRLKIINSDGNYKYSNVVTVNILAQPTEPDYIFKILTNPAAGSVKVKVRRTGSANDELLVTDMLGRLIKREKLLLSASEQTITIGLNNIAPGTYILSFISNSKRVKSTAFVLISY